METIEDIVKEMRGHEGHCLFDEDDIASLADRIEAADAELMKKIQQLEQENGRLKDYLAANEINLDKAITGLTAIEKAVDEKMAEIAKLKAALKPVLGAETDGIVTNYEGTQFVEGFDLAYAAVDAITEAKRIYNNLNGDKQSNEN